MATKLTKKQQTQLTEKLTGIIQKNNALQLRLSVDTTVNEMNVNQISGALNRIHGQAIGKELPTVVTIPVKQSGSGDPSPDNIRPIIGYEIDGIGTVYGGDINTDDLTLTTSKQLITLRGTSFVASATYRGSFYQRNETVRQLYGVRPRDNREFICTHAKSVPNVGAYARGCCLSDTSINFWIMPPDTTLAGWHAYLQNQRTAETPVQILVETAVTETYTLTPQQMIQLLDQL